MFQDETGFTQHPRVGRGWGKRGERLRIPTTSQHHERLNVSGWVAPLLGRYGMIRTPRGNREGLATTSFHGARDSSKAVPPLPFFTVSYNQKAGYGSPSPAFCQ